MNTTCNPFNLHHILNANAMFSFTSGLFFLPARNPLAEFLGASPTAMIHRLIRAASTTQGLETLPEVFGQDEMADDV